MYWPSQWKVTVHICITVLQFTMKSMLNAWSLIVFLHLGFYARQGRSQKCQQRDALRDYRLINHIIDTISVSPASCATSCAKKSNCFSTNYFRTNRLCEHNNKTKLFAREEDFVFHEESFYLELLEKSYDPCVVENPCKNGGKCSPHFNNGTYSCQCTRHYTGQHCETLKKSKFIHMVPVLGLLFSFFPFWLVLRWWAYCVFGPIPYDSTNRAYGPCLNAVDVSRCSWLLCEHDIYLTPQYVNTDVRPYKAYMNLHILGTSLNAGVRTYKAYEYCIGNTSDYARTNVLNLRILHTR